LPSLSDLAWKTHLYDVVALFGRKHLRNQAATTVEIGQEIFRQVRESRGTKANHPLIGSLECLPNIGRNLRKAPVHEDEREPSQPHGSQSSFPAGRASHGLPG
jgi:hypothetical protein